MGPLSHHSQKLQLTLIGPLQHARHCSIIFLLINSFSPQLPNKEAGTICTRSRGGWEVELGWANRGVLTLLNPLPGGLGVHEPPYPTDHKLVSPFSKLPTIHTMGGL